MNNMWFASDSDDVWNIGGGLWHWFMAYGDFPRNAGGLTAGIPPLNSHGVNPVLLQEIVPGVMCHKTPEQLTICS